MERVLQKDRDASAAIGKNYGHRPASYKGSLSLKLDYTRKKSPEREVDVRYRERRPRSRSPDRGTRNDATSTSGPSRVTSQEQLEKMKKLKAMYGDASASGQ